MADQDPDRPADPFAADGRAPLARGGKQQAHSFGTGPGQSLRYPRTPPAPPPSRSEAPWPVRPEPQAKKPVTIAKDAKLRITENKMGEKRLRVYSSGGVFDVKLSPLDHHRAPGWYTTQWKRIGSG
jgi:hypothetical protein